MITGSIEGIYTHYTTLEDQYKMAKRRSMSYAQKKWLVSYTSLKQDTRTDKNEKQIFTDTIFGCTYIYDVKRNNWTCKS
jgi:hypothetical protein